MRSGKAETLCQGEDFGHGIEGNSSGRAGGRVQPVVPCRVSSGSDNPFEDLHHLASEPEASGFSHAMTVSHCIIKKGTLSNKFSETVYSAFGLLLNISLRLWMGQFLCGFYIFDFSSWWWWPGFFLRE